MIYKVIGDVKLQMENGSTITMNSNQIMDLINENICLRESETMVRKQLKALKEEIKDNSLPLTEKEKRELLIKNSMG